MSRRNRLRKQAANNISKWEKEAICIASKIIKIEVQNQEINEKFKTVFYCESKTKPEGRMCIVWGRTTFKEGNEITMTGRMKEDVFLVWRYLYKPEKPKEN